MKETKERGITLVALIITIVVIVILGAVTINAAFGSGIIDTAVNGTISYEVAQKKEKVTFDELDGSLQNIVAKIEEYGITEESKEGKIKFSEEPTGKAVENTNDSIEITVMASYESEDVKLTYTLWWEDDSGELKATDIVVQEIQGKPVKLVKKELSNNTVYKFKVVVSKDKYITSSISNSARTYCKAGVCKGGIISTETCAKCDGNKNITCPNCNRKSRK
ncbi:MAG: hypothetical protein HFJ24_00670 [Clostridia bacterium]|nr:hypothetical protein [Clostridia bacterium]MCI9274593.1 hypothetical protein [Clostridia bacterium]